MRDERPPEVGWLAYRLAVAVCSAVLACATLIVFTLVVMLLEARATSSATFLRLAIKWGPAVVVGAAVLGFIFGGERMAHFFSFLWGTHPVWGKIDAWLQDNEIRAWLEENGIVPTWLGVALIMAVIGVVALWTFS